MKRALAVTLIASVALFSVACHKNTSGPSAGYGPNSIFPTTNGDTWYFMDSAWTDSTQAFYPDTMVATKNAIQDSYGSIYLEMQNPYGWFAGSYINVDPNNYFVQEVDSPNLQSAYTMFALVSSDGPISQPYQDFTNPSCPITYSQVGYANQVQEYGYNCYKNVELVTDCNNNVLEQTNYYLSPGVGPVRIEDFLADTTGKLNEVYSQTLTGKALK